MASSPPDCAAILRATMNGLILIVWVNLIVGLYGKAIKPLESYCGLVAVTSPIYIYGFVDTK